jgi:hypothetical protein
MSRLALPYVRPESSVYHLMGFSMALKPKSRRVRIQAHYLIAIPADKAPNHFIAHPVAAAAHDIHGVHIDPDSPV